MTFPAIHDPSGPEEFSWEVELSGDQELQQVDERHAEVVFDGGAHMAYGITAGEASDATGAEVPTTLVLSEGDIITLIVHHRAGNPLTGQPFVYPVVAGKSWEGGFQTVQIEGPPPDPSAEPTEVPREEATHRAPRKGEVGGPPAFRLGPPNEGTRTSPELVFGTGWTIAGPTQLVAYGWKPEANSAPADFCVWIESVRLRETDYGDCDLPVEQTQREPIAIDMEIGGLGAKSTRATAIGGRVSPDVTAVRLYFHRHGSRKLHHLDAIVGQVSGDLQQRLKQPAPFGFFYARVRGLVRFRAIYAQALDADGNVIGRAHGLTAHYVNAVPPARASHL